MQVFSAKSPGDSADSNGVVYSPKEESTYSYLKQSIIKVKILVYICFLIIFILGKGANYIINWLYRKI